MTKRTTTLGMQKKEKIVVGVPNGGANLERDVELSWRPWQGREGATREVSATSSGEGEGEEEGRRLLESKGKEGF